jgi:formylglycine-generating enzyme required for sulfatase activity
MMQGTFKNSAGMEFVLVPSGSFQMGGDKVTEQAEDHETPVHRVEITQPFYIGTCVVTQAQWARVMDTRPSEFAGDLHPVEGVSWNDAQDFIRALNAKEGTAAYRLPTEAQWEYASRAGTAAAYTYGAETGNLDTYAWYKKNSGGQPHPVGQLKPNAWGLHDMHGNVHEWCLDWFDRNYYKQSPKTDPPGPSSGLARALRGGDWSSLDWYCRCASRSLSSPDRRSSRVGFRLVMNV